MDNDLPIIAGYNVRVRFAEILLSFGDKNVLFPASTTTPSEANFYLPSILRSVRIHPLFWKVYAWCNVSKFSMGKIYSIGSQ